jgi:hypothetical protein
MRPESASPAGAANYTECERDEEKLSEFRTRKAGMADWLF